LDGKRGRGMEGISFFGDHFNFLLPILGGNEWRKREEKKSKIYQIMGMGSIEKYHLSLIILLEVISPISCFFY
jgi:hypothetical protein